MKGWYKDRMEDPSSGELAQLRQQIARLKTEHRKMESTLRTYQSAVESASDAIFVKDLKSRYVVANDKALAAFGLSRDEVIGRDDYELMPDQKEARKNVEDDRYVFQIGKPKRITKHMTGADGRKSWFEAVKVPQFDDEGNVIGLVGIARDITELKETEIALNGGERRYQTTFEHTGTAMLIIEEDTTISLVNHQFELLSGYSREEIEGKKSWAEFVHPEDLEGMKKSHYGRREPGAETLAQYEFRFIDRRGNVKDIFLTVDAIPGMKQSVAALIDITKRKQAEDALRESNELKRLLMESSPEKSSSRTRILLMCLQTQIIPRT